MDRSDIIKKALKLRTHALQGDNKEFAEKKFREYCMDNSITFDELSDAHKEDLKPVSQKKIVINGQTFNNTAEFKDWYLKQSVWKRMSIAVEVAKIKF